MSSAAGPLQDMLVTRLKKDFGFKSYLEPLRAQLADGFSIEGAPPRR
jgi:hypothetical protein